jgi:glyoxylase-like metal-dependent hydrolase (beta-lactamase superfamily II)
MKISVYTGGFAQTNGYLIETPDGNFLIDAPEGVTAWIEKRGVRVDHVLLTHQHYDHVLDAAAMKATGATLHALEDYSTDLTLESLRLPIKVTPYAIDRKFAMDEPLEIAGVVMRLAHVPGHSTDSVTLYLADAGLLFSGDTLFARSIGRTDLPHGSTEQLLAGISKHLLTLPVETKVFPGHGPSTTIGIEVRENPYLR